ncbi:hypothetical protein PV325_008969 [Microctonus aethiopoides]|nr:hypothetical protein PV325_008969 [Microctonus aethiopoides]
MDKMSWNQDEKVGSSSDEPYDREVLDNDVNLSHDNSDIQQRLPFLYHGAWPMERDVWNNLQCGVNQHDNSTIVASVMSFTSDTSTGVHNSNRNNDSSNEGKFDAKMDVIYSLLGMLLGDHVGREDTSTTLLSLSNSVENCLAMKESGCLPLLVQLIHAPEQNPAVRKGASRALYNIVRATQDKKFGRQELHVLGLIEQLRDHSTLLRMNIETDEESQLQSHPISAISALMKLSFNENHRHAMCQMGGLHAIGELIEMDHAIHGSDTNDPNCISLRRYAGMILTNLTFGDSKNKSLLCSFEGFIKALVAQLQSNNEDLHQVTASVLRNLSWRADSNSKIVLREAGSVTSLTVAAMQSRRESTLKSILSALWNFSAHCTINKVNICSVYGALGFLVDLLSFKAPSKRLAILENAGGILRNVSSHVAIDENYRQILRNKNCLHTLVTLLNCPSLTVVSNACGTLWNLSARCPRDQKTLWELGAVPKLRNLMHSKHKLIAMGATAALRNLLTARNVTNSFTYIQSNFRSPLHPSEQQKRQQQQQVTIDSSVNLSKSRPAILGASCRSRSVEDNRQNHIEERPMSSKSWHSPFSRHPSSPLNDETLHNDDDTNQINVEKSEDNSESQSECRKGSPAESPYFEQRLDTENSPYEADGDQPIDYSKKYMENGGGVGGGDGKSVGSNKQKQNLKIKTVRREKTYHQERNTNIFGDYAETDLDQPTDYSLRYAEDDTDDEEKQSTQYFTVNEQEDTIKTYYTEGTPYETPCNFSTATSMSNLRLEECKDGETLKKVYKKSENIKVKEFENNNVPEKVVLHEKAKAESIKNDSAAAESNNPQDKPMYYYDEGSPGPVSRANSLSSLESAIVTRSEEVTNETSEDSENIQQKMEKSELKSLAESPAVIEDKETQIIEEKCSDKEGKVVTFGGEDHYAEETPLMFSRSSSLGSLSGFEQYSIHDDRSSIISDFSRRTSGVVSPSELPDSPTQTVPPSPRHQKNPIDFSMRTQDERRTSSFSKFSFHKPKASVFEDDTAAFKEESTPIEFSAATSLSSLTIDDDLKPSGEAVIIVVSNQEQNEKVDEILPNITSPSSPVKETESQQIVEANDRAPDDVSDGDEEDGDEDILAACINMGMQNNRYRQSFKKTDPKTFPTSVSNLIRYQTSSTLDRLETINIAETKRVSLSPLKSKLNMDLPLADTVHVYCTEDTPADISPVGSQSNLSALSLPSIVEDFEKPDEVEEARNDLSDDNSNLSGDDEKILDECIQSGMPKRISPTATIMTSKNKSEMFLPRMNEFSNVSNSPGPRDNHQYLTRTVEKSADDSNNSYDDSPNHSDDDDAILAECIESAMPKARPNNLTNKASTSRQSEKIEDHFDNNKIDQLKSPRSEDSLSLSEDEEDMILAQCIRSGMPKASTSAINFTPVSRDDGRRLYGALSSPRNCSPRHIVQRKDLMPMASTDEISDFATEDTPCNFSVISEISNLSINSNYD